MPINFPTNSGLYERPIQKESETILKVKPDTMRLHEKRHSNYVIDLHSTKNINNKKNI